MALQIKKAVRSASYARLALMSPSGGGKTLTSLIIGTVLAAGKPVLLVDSEHGSASKYAGVSIKGLAANKLTFDAVELGHFSPENYLEALELAQSEGYGVVIFDSLSHVWNGPGGFLEFNSQLAKRKYNNNTFNAWNETTPKFKAFIDAILASKIHVIATLRASTDHIQEKDETTGKTVVRKVGMGAEMRKGIEYEFDIVGELSVPGNELIITKSRCLELTDKIIPRPGVPLGQTILNWLQGDTTPSQPPPSTPNLPPLPSKTGIGIGTPLSPSPHSAASSTHHGSEQQQQADEAGTVVAESNFEQFGELVRKASGGYEPFEVYQMFGLSGGLAELGVEARKWFETERGGPGSYEPLTRGQRTTVLVDYVRDRFERMNTPTDPAPKPVPSRK